MSLLHINYYSQPIGKQCGMYVVLPDGEGPYHTVYLLHGNAEDYSGWLRRTGIERDAEERGLMVVMLDGARSFYTDLQFELGQFEQHILESVRFIDRTFQTLASAEGRSIGGFSMGGYGAMKLGLKYPDLFGSVAAHSGVLDIAAYFVEKDWRALTTIFGERVAPEENCFALAALPGRKPAIYFDCGIDDSFLVHNRRFHAHLQTLGIEHRYEEFPGKHNWAYWDEHLADALDFHLACRQG